MPKRTILIQVDPNAPREEMKIVTSGTRPGEIITIDANGQAARGAVAAAANERTIVVEDALQGKTIDDTYSAGDLAPVVIPRPGDIVLLRLKTGNTVVIGSPLDVAGALGEVQLATVGTTKDIVATALEAKSTAGLILARIK